MIFSLGCSRDFFISFLNTVPFVQIHDSNQEETSANTLVTSEPILENSDLQETITETPTLLSTASIENNTLGPDPLNSYRTTFITILTGVDQEEKEVREKTTISQEVIRDLGSFHFKILSEINQKQEQNIDLFTIDSQNFFWDQSIGSGSNSLCISYSNLTDPSKSSFNFDTLSPEIFFKDIKRDELIEEGVLVNDILTNHYSVKDSSFEKSDLHTKKAEIWFAQQGDYVVRFYGEAEGESPSLIDGRTVTGKLIWEYDLIDADRVETIDLPDQCAIASKENFGIPLPDNAQNINVSGDLISFFTPDEPAKMVYFFDKTISAEGFSRKDYSESENIFILVLQKENKTFNIMISPEDGGSSIVISAD